MEISLDQDLRMPTGVGKVLHMTTTEKGQTMTTTMTAQEAEQKCREEARAENRWTDDECQIHCDDLDRNGECSTCLDDAHEAWLLAR